jgi:hypothetical protein
MLVKDEEMIRRHVAAMEYQEDNEKLARYLEDQLKPPGGFNDDQGLSRCNPEKQRGRTMSTEEFEKKLSSIAPHLVFRSYGNPTKKGVYWNFGTPHQQGLPFENSLSMPEFSIFEPVTRELMSPVEELSAADLPKFEIVPEERDAAGNVTREAAINWAGPLPGTVKREDAWREKVRGWRQLLVMLVIAKQITIADMERVFGSANRRGYAHYLGKHECIQVN